MRTFVLRARAAPTDSQKLLASVGKDAHTEILAHPDNAACSAIASDVVYRCWCTQDYSRTIRFEPDAMHDIGGFDERALLGKIAKALDASRGMSKEEARPVESGVTVRTISFERLVLELSSDHQLFVMDRKGTSIREQAFEGNPCFLLTDHIPMPKKSFNSLERLGAKKLTLGSKMLFASQCVVLISTNWTSADGIVSAKSHSRRRECPIRRPAIRHRCPACRNSAVHRVTPAFAPDHVHPQSVAREMRADVRAGTPWPPVRGSDRPSAHRRGSPARARRIASCMASPRVPPATGRDGAGAAPAPAVRIRTAAPRTAAAPPPCRPPAIPPGRRAP
jgi:tRNA (pseudouridine54-N1)-methyltransferase